MKQTIPAVLVVDSGDAFAKHTSVSSMERWQVDLKAELIAQAMVKMGIDAMLPGVNDFALGKRRFMELARAHKLPYLAANLRSIHGEQIFPASRTLKVEGLTVTIIGVVSTDLEEQGFQVSSAEEAIREHSAAARAAGADVVMILSGLGLTRTEHLMKPVSTVDFVIVSGTGRNTSSPVTAGSAALLEAGKRGKTVGVLKLRPVKGGEGWAYMGAAAQHAKELQRAEQRLADIQKRAKKANSDQQRASYERQLSFYSKRVEELKAREIAQPDGANEFTNRFENLSRSVDDEPAVLALVEETKALIEKGAPQGLDAPPPKPDVEIAFDGLTGPALLVARKAEGVTTFGDFVGAQTCMGCHPAEYQQWAGTQHSHAWQTLVDESRSRDFDCFSCHITGHGKPGGPTSPDRVGYLKGVQCESCHGVGAAHVADPTGVKLSAKVPEETCRSCHSVEQTGDRFDYKTYLPKVVHTSR